MFRSFNSKLRDECLNEEVFASLTEARAVIKSWQLDYSHVRPHSAHGGLTPKARRLNPAAARLLNLQGYSAINPLGPHNRPAAGGGQVGDVQMRHGTRRIISLTWL